MDFVFLSVIAVLGFASVVGGQESPILRAAKEGDTATINELLTSGVDPDTKDEHGQTALMLAADNGHVEAVKALLDKGAKVDSRNSLRATALMLAGNRGHARVVEELLGAGADVNVAAADGLTPLMVTVPGRSENALRIVKALIASGADVNAQEDNRATALMIACSGPPPPPPPPRGWNRPAVIDTQSQIVTLLLNSGARADLKDQRGQTALDYANYYSNDGLADLLKAWDSNRRRQN
jgi:uncharacterized protein